MNQFSLQEMQRRFTSVLKMMKTEQIDTLVVAGQEKYDYHLRWLIGCATPEIGYLILRSGENPLLIVKEYFAEDVKDRTIPDFITIMPHTKPEASVCEQVANSGLVARVNIDQIPFEAVLQFKEQFPKARDLTKAYNKIKAIKSDEEIEAIRRACQLADLAMKTINTAAHSGITEKELADQAEYAMKQNGGGQMPWDIGILSGDRARGGIESLHTKRPLQEGDLVMVDLDAVYEGYHADIARTFFIGRPDPELRKIYGILEEVQKWAVDQISSGLITGELQSEVKIRLGEYAQYFIHGLGHGVGIDPHEAPPSFSDESEHILQAGMTLAIEVGIYIPGLCSMRIEDDVLVTDKGYEKLTGIL